MGRKKTAAAETEVAEAPAPTIPAIKGFTHELKCNGGGTPFQFEIGKTYKIDGRVEACRRGFHAVLDNPFHVWDFYPIINYDGKLSRYAEVELGGNTDKQDDEYKRGTKIAAAEITIKAEVSLPDFIRRAVNAVVELTKGKGDNPSGDYARIGSSGDYARIGSSGDYARIGSSGHSAQIGSSGDYARIGSSGDSARIGSSGDYARIGSSGDSAQIGSSGHSAQIGSSGDYARIGSSGDYAQIGSSGHSAQIGSSGDYARIGSSGDSAQITAEGKHAVVACAGVGATVTAAAGGAICISYSDGKRTRFAVGYVGESGIEAGVAYRADVTGALGRA